MLPLAYQKTGPASSADPAASRWERAAWGLLGVASLSVLTLSIWISPDPSGHGSHMQLGLPACAFFLSTSLPCPGCGLTTSFAHMARLEVLGALAANAAGVPLYLLTVAALPTAVLGVARGWPLWDTLERLHTYRVSVAVSALVLLQWGAKLLGLWPV